MTRTVSGRSTLGGLLLGVGLGGFIDGIVLHQILQWHHMLSSVLPPTDMAAMQTNMRWDGIFHLFVWMLTVGGVFLLWSGARRSLVLPDAGWLGGLLLVGWGAFNLVEGLVNHRLLGLHHVRGYGPSPGWDLAFLLSGLVLALIGWLFIRKATAKPNPRPRI